MATIWKAVGILVAVMLICGLLLAGAGLLTGASPDRVQSVLSDDFGNLQTMYGHAKDIVAELLPVVQTPPAG